MRRCSARFCNNSEPQGASRGCLLLAFPRCGTSVRAAVVETRHPRLAPRGSRTNHSRRAGYTLVFFAMLMFALMGLAALVIDIGFARLTQRQMQTAVDSAAVEGLRWRDVNEWEEVPQGWLGDPDFITLFDDNEDFIGTITNDVDKDRIRRWVAQQVVLNTFDDDLESGNGDDGAFDGGGQFGAGPVVALSGGVGDPIMNASQLLTIPTTPFYKPAVEQNLGNEIHGDMVAGAYDGAATIHDEYSTYVRTDFDSMGDDAFLVRLRRTNDFEGLDSIAGESSSGPPLSYLFGRGSLLAFRDPGVTYSPRHHGMTVRATGISDARPALSVGMPDGSVTPPLNGLARFALFLSEWNDLPVGTAVSRDLSLDGVISEMGATTGRFFDFGPVSLMPVVVGRTLPASSAPLAGEYTGYVSIYGEFTSGSTTVNRIVGFGLATALVAPSEIEVMITRGTQQLVVENVAGVVCHAVTLTDDEWEGVLNVNKDLYDLNFRDVSGTLLAPVSVR